MRERLSRGQRGQDEQEGPQHRQEPGRVCQPPTPVGPAPRKLDVSVPTHSSVSSRRQSSTSAFENGFVMKRLAPERSASSRSRF